MSTNPDAPVSNEAGSSGTGVGMGKVTIGAGATKITPESKSISKPPTVPQLHALRALLTGGGIGLPGAWTSIANGLNAATAFTGQLNRIVNAGIAVAGLARYAQNNLPGVALMVAGGVLSNQLKDSGLSENNIIVSALTRANQMFKDPVSFLKMASRAQDHAEASFGQAATNGLLGFVGSVGNLLMGVRTLTDLLTGGVTATIGPGADNTISGQRIAASGIPLSANDIRQGLAAVAQAIRGFGTLFDIGDSHNIGTPLGIINSLRAQGIADAINLDKYLNAAGVDPARVEIYSPVDQKDALSLIKGADLAYVIRKTNITIWNPLNQINSVADLLSPGNILPQAALEHIPGASLVSFGEAIDSWGITGNASWVQIADMLDSLEIPDCPDINNVNIPSFYASIGPYVPSGSGLFGQAGVKDFIGTVGGHVHQEACAQISAASGVIQGSPEGQALKAAMDYFELHQDPADPLYNYAVGQMQLAMQNLARSSNPNVQAAINKSNTAGLDSALQIVAEVQNAVAIAGAVVGAVEGIIDAADALYAKVSTFVATSNPKPEPASTSAMTVQSVLTEKGDLLKGLQGAWDALNKLVSFILDDLGLGQMIEGMITTDASGQSLRACIAEIRNQQALARVGINPSRGSLDYENYARVLAATKGEGLTPLQIRIISTDAILKGLDPRDMLALNSIYGYDHEYYDRLQYS